MGKYNLLPQHQNEIIRRYFQGEISTKLAEEFKVSVGAIRSYVHKYRAHHPDIKRMAMIKKDKSPFVNPFGPPRSETPVKCEGITQSYRDSLRWAIDAAGAYLRTSLEPISCPCDAAWYLFKQAISEPKDFLGRLGQAESKGDADGAEKENLRRSGQKSVSEIEQMLKELGE